MAVAFLATELGVSACTRVNQCVHALGVTVVPTPSGGRGLNTSFQDPVNVLRNLDLVVSHNVHDSIVGDPASDFPVVVFEPSVVHCDEVCFSESVSVASPSKLHKLPAADHAAAAAASAHTCSSNSVLVSRTHFLF